MKIEIEQYVNNEYCIASLEEPDDCGNDLWYTGFYQDTDQWCEATFGPSDRWGEIPKNGWKRMRNKYFFTDNNKLTLFCLKWG